jgi:hypothetical protein
MKMNIKFVESLPNSMEELKERLVKHSIMRNQFGGEVTLDPVTCIRGDGRFVLDKMAEMLGIPCPTTTKRNVLIGKIFRHEKCKEFFTEKTTVFYEDLIDKINRKDHVEITVDMDEPIFSPCNLNFDIKSHEMYMVLKNMFKYYKVRLNKKELKMLKPLYDELDI